MEILNIILAVLLILLAIALIVFVLFQTGGQSNRKLSQVISGGSPENYTGKNKQRSKDKKLAKVTTIIAIVFAVLVIVFALIMNYQHNHPSTST
ncbi:MAG: preprotein translocase subunit SecG, partial [Clostridia bacterium]|nr:preprotein translocase subunit SecG [Clostridia bacterium]